MDKMTRFGKTTVGLMVFTAAVSLIGSAVVIWAIVHFARKFW
jgi:hypothetical protein